MMMLKKLKNNFGILQEKFKILWDFSWVVSVILLKKRLNIVVFLKQFVKNMLLFFLVSGGVFDFGVVNI